jgi:hypothetical protein
MPASIAGIVFLVSNYNSKFPISNFLIPSFVNFLRGQKKEFVIHYALFTFGTLLVEV